MAMASYSQNADVRTSKTLNGQTTQYFWDDQIMIKIFKNDLNEEEKGTIMTALILGQDRKWKNYMIYEKNLGNQE